MFVVKFIYFNISFKQNSYIYKDMYGTKNLFLQIMLKILRWDQQLYSSFETFTQSFNL